MPLRPFLRTDIAYFSMEIAFPPETTSIFSCGVRSIRYLRSK